MADSITETYRPIYLEDMAVSTTLAQTTATILGLGPGIPVTPLLVGAINDADAAAKGVGINGVYLLTAAVPYRLVVRVA